MTTSGGLVLPRTVEGVTPEWLTKALQVMTPGVVVTSFKTDKILWGTATKILIDVEYLPTPESQGLPSKLCVKGEFDEKLREKLKGVSVTGTQIEADFYNDLSPEMDVPLVRHWFAGSEPGMGILILDNLAAENWKFCVPTEPWTPDLIAGGLDILAKLHASTWGKTFPNIPWLRVGSEPLEGFSEHLMSQKHWDAHFGRQDVYQLREYLQDRERGISALRKMWEYDKTNATCILHGDTHLGNTCITPDGKPLLIDWAGVSICHWAQDIPYFIVGGMNIEQRRNSEEDLLRHYLDRLEAFGGPKLDWDTAWMDYRRHIIHGLVWGTLPPEMQPVEFVQEMGSRYGAAMEDHDSLGLWDA